MNITFFYTDECGKCAELKPIVSEFNNALGIKMVNTYEEELITESYDVEWVPTLVIEIIEICACYYHCTSISNSCFLDALSYTHKNTNIDFLNIT